MSVFCFTGASVIPLPQECANVYLFLREGRTGPDGRAARGTLADLGVFSVLKLDEKNHHVLEVTLLGGTHHQR